MSIRGIGKKYYSTLRLFVSDVISARNHLYEMFINLLYSLLPTTPGGLDSDLQEEVEHILLFLGIRIRTFNIYYGSLVDYGAVLGFVGFSIGIVVAFLATLFLNEIPFVILDLAAVVTLLIFLVAFAILMVSNLILMLYILSFARYSLNRIQKSLLSESQNEPQKYDIYIFGDDNRSHSYREVNIYKDNIIRFTRIIVYSILSLAIALVLLLSSHMSDNEILQSALIRIESILSRYGTDKFTEIIDHVSLLIPFDISALLSIDILESVLWVVCGILLFGVFLNWQRIAQHSVESRFDSSDFDKFTISEEFSRYRRVLRVILYYMLELELRDEFSILRGQIIIMAISLSMGISLTAVLIYGSLNL